ncbi:MAG: polynucleotide phosphorylase [Sulfuricurvum sp. PC08-66]|nr:MAG: polynucleotide phosphorylase [Sulfuricurvum sp. PC08-66]
MNNVIKFNHANIEESYRFDFVAKQANGAVWLTEGKSVMLATVSMDDALATEEDFVPLTVQYIEKSYAAGRIPGGFVKRESKPSDFETLTSRIIDRSLRPLFPKGFGYAVQITVMVLSADKSVDLQRMALNAASAALFASDLPIRRSVTGQRLALIDGEFVINPTLQQLQNSALDLFLAGTRNELLMIEMRTMGTQKEEFIELPLIDPMLDPSLAMQTITRQVDNVLSEERLIEAIALLQASIFGANEAYENGFAAITKRALPLVLNTSSEDSSLAQFIQNGYAPTIESALMGLAKSERGTVLSNLVKEIVQTPFVIEGGFSKSQVSKIVERLKREAVRRQIIVQHRRADGRALDEVRPISIETNVLPLAHSSVLFTRGQTQALAVLTLGGNQDAQMYQNITDSETKHEHLMIHYNFPGFSVGEASRIGPAGRRELGHGNLAKRAIEPTMMDNGKTVRIVSEVLESNGSSSMATVCASSLALVAAQLEVSNLVAGVAMGLVQEGDTYAILTDIMGLEDHDGDMDFKIAGTNEGISAMQMDIKLGGISLDILSEALAQAKKARLHILGIMDDAAKQIVPNEGVLPSTDMFVVDPSKIVDIIGQAGKTIREIIERFGVSIDLDKTKGHVKVSGTSKEQIEQAKAHIRGITSKQKVEYKEGDILMGKVKKLVDFGAFIELPDGQDGLLHISKISAERISHPNEVLQEGQEMKVKISGFKGKKIELDRA